MLVEPQDLTAEDVLRLVQEHWEGKARNGAFVPRGAGAHHWVCGGPRQPHWFVTADDVTARGRLEELEAAYAVARRLAHKGLHFVVPTVAPTNGGVGVRHGRYLVTVTAYLEGESGPGAYADDNQRALIAHEIGQLHAAKPPRRAPVWEPTLPCRAELERLLETVDGGPWESGPFGESVRVALRDNRTHILRLLARLDVLTAQALARREGWVLTHGEPHTANVLWQLGGPVLVDWESLRLAPRERDLRVVLRDADGAEPLSAYVASGGDGGPGRRHGRALRPPVVAHGDRPLCGAVRQPARGRCGRSPLPRGLPRRGGACGRGEPDPTSPPRPGAR